MKKYSKEESNSQTIDSKYIQQHLANERTFLAWIRTAIAIIGLGFLVTNLHYSLVDTRKSEITDLFASIIGYASIVIGIITIILASISYLKKLKTINNQSFQSTTITLVSVGVLVILIGIIFAGYIAVL
ncbi:YidH family protein [Ornithinibacillus halophilus]|uniref:Putative membrane protein n=1 Tax=Ornithinibacillus halophilus TaxID=930117 RepID=A0A1M5LLC5_9BACI|nr:DUF202 domain-containing protein [Ornithinibacillus halophilus]SHG65815.1 putative membrane protein [Ornithinibacillus halophilus]